MSHSTAGVVVQGYLLILLLTRLSLPPKELISSSSVSSSKCTKLFQILRIDVVYALKNKVAHLYKVQKVSLPNEGEVNYSCTDNEHLFRR